MGLTARQSELALADLDFAALRLGEDKIMEVGCAESLLQPNFEVAKTSYVIVFRKKVIQIGLKFGFVRLNLK